MGLKESGLRGSLRNVSVGIDAIPDSDIYLQDDWGDNKLTDREGSGTTTHNDEEGVYRPEWTLEIGSPTAEDERLKLDRNQLLFTEINLNLDETVTWEFVGVHIPDEWAGLGLFAETNNVGDMSNFREHNLQSGYHLILNEASSESVRLLKMNGSATELIESGSHSGIVNIEVTRSPSGEWSLNVDGSNEGSTTDTDHDNPQYIGFSQRDDSVSNPLELDEFKVS